MRRHLWWVLGLVLVVAGVAITLSANSGPDDFGWFVAAPGDRPDWSMGWPDSGTFGPFVLVSRWQLIGCVIAVLGLIVVAAGLGFRLGRRRGLADT